MKPNPIKERTFQFAIQIFNYAKHLIDNHKEFVISKQLLKSGTSVGANVREAEFAETKPDFRHKIGIALKEINETIYWLDLLNSTLNETNENLKWLKSESSQILAILITILKKSKEK